MGKLNLVLEEVILKLKKIAGKNKNLAHDIADKISKTGHIDERALDIIEEKERKNKEADSGDG